MRGQTGPAHGIQRLRRQVPGRGIGQRRVQSRSENNAVDSSGDPQRRPRSVLDGDRRPDRHRHHVSKLVDKLRCRRVAERVRVPPRWKMIKRGHKRIRVLRRAHTKTIHVTECHARTVRRRRTV